MILLLIVGPLLVPPEASAAGVKFKSIASRWSLSLALDEEGTIWGRGYNRQGQFGDGTSSGEYSLLKRIEVTDGAGTPVAFQQVEPGANHSVALDTDGQVWTTGLDEFGSLGNGTSPSSLAWEKLAVSDGSGPVKFTQVTANRDMTYALDDTGRLWGWGKRLHSADPDQVPSLVPIADGGSPVAWASISANDFDLFGIDSNHRLWQIQSLDLNPQAYALDDGGIVPQFQAIAVGGGTGDGGFLALGLEGDGDIWIWGTNNYGQQGDGMADPDTRWSPEKLTILDGGSPVKFVQITGGNHHALAMDTHGNVWAWGKNGDGQLGDGTTTSGALPQKIAVMDNGTPIHLTSVAAGYEESYGLDAEGRIWSWGGGQTVPAKLAIASTVAVTASKPASTYLEEITLTATVSGDLEMPTGSIEFREDATVLGNVPLAGGTAELDISALSVGSHSIVAYYEGDENYVAGASAALAHTVVMPAAPAIALTPSPTSDTFDPVTVSASVQIDGAGNGLNSLKWLAGNRVASDFASAGTDITVAQSFDAASNGTYTVYAKDQAGSEAVKTISIVNILTAGDPAALEAAIADAQQALDDHPAGSGVGQAPAGARSALSAAIGVAQAVADDAAHRTQAQLDAAQATLDSAVDAFEGAVIGAGDPAALEAAIADAQQALDDHPAGTDVGQAPAGARSALSAAIGVAQAVADDAANRTQAQLDAAQATLAGAVATFRAVVVGVVLTPPDAGLYGAGDVLAFKLTYRDEVVVKGTPRIAIALGDGSVTDVVYAAYTGVRGATVTSLSFTYEVPVGMADTDGIELSPRVDLPDGARIDQAAGGTAMLMYDVSDTSAVRVVSIPPALALSADTAPGSTVAVTVTAGVYGDSSAGNTLVKLLWLEGSRTAADFEGGNAGKDILAARAFTVGANGVYTVYARDAAGNEAVQAVNVSAIVTPSGPQEGSGPDPAEIEDPLRKYIVRWTADKAARDTKWKQEELAAAAIRLDGRALFASPAESWTLTLPSDTVSLLLQANPNGVLQVRTGLADYELPVTVLGDLSDRPFDELRMKLSLAGDAEQHAVAQAAERLGAAVQGPALKLELSLVAGGIEQSLSGYGRYVPVTVPRPALGAQGRLLSALYIEAQQTFAPVPARPGDTDVQWKIQANGIYALLTYDKQFADVQGSWAEEAVRTLASMLIVKGVDDANFAPDAPVTRAEMTAMVVRGLGLQDEAWTSPNFGDVAENSWHAGAVAAAVQADIVQGDAAGRFRPDALISRQEAAVMLLRAMRAAGYAPDSGTPSALGAFADAGQISAWAREAMDAAVANGLMQGDPAARLHPQQPITRAESAAMLLRMLRAVGFLGD